MALFVPHYSTLLLFCMTKFAIVCLRVSLDDLNGDEGAIVRNMWEYSSTGTFKNIYTHTIWCNEVYFKGKIFAL